MSISANLAFANLSGFALLLYLYSDKVDVGPIGCLWNIDAALDSALDSGEQFLPIG